MPTSTPDDDHSSERARGQELFGYAARAPNAPRPRPPAARRRDPGSLAHKAFAPLAKECMRIADWRLRLRAFRSC
eukprot:360727-Alexandrium_andersonii.AAC.1